MNQETVFTIENRRAMYFKEVDMYAADTGMIFAKAKIRNIFLETRQD